MLGDSAMGYKNAFFVQGIIFLSLNLFTCARGMLSKNDTARSICYKAYPYNKPVYEMLCDNKNSLSVILNRLNEYASKNNFSGDGCMLYYALKKCEYEKSALRKKIKEMSENKERLDVDISKKMLQQDIDSLFQLLFKQGVHKELVYDQLFRAFDQDYTDRFLMCLKQLSFNQLLNSMHPVYKESILYYAISQERVWLHCHKDRKKFKTMLQLLMQHGADPRKSGIECGATPLLIAIGGNYVQSLQALINVGINFSKEKDSSGMTYCEVAALLKIKVPTTIESPLLQAPLSPYSADINPVVGYDVSLQKLCVANYFEIDTKTKKKEAADPLPATL